MIQQINLYQPILRREKKVFSAVMMLQVLGAVAVLMLALFAVSRWQLERLEDERARLWAQERELTARFTAYSQALAGRPESQELRRQVELAQRELELKQRLAALLQQRPDGAAVAGFAAAFEGLARQRVPGLWLTGIELQKHDDRREVTLRGMTARAELVPQLVQRLGEEAAFEGVRFEQLHVFQPENATTDALAFELTTRPPAEEDAP